ncbi:MAG: DUF1295 domain-containing protein [Pseudomonadales bacterium]|nr:DUF1295 domain-containing protein [Pseudomonadales bacterium]
MMDAVAGLFTPLLVYAMITALHWFLPAATVEGYVTDPGMGRPLRYRLNGRRVLLASIALWLVLGTVGLVPFDWLYRTRWAGLGGAFVLGLTFTLWIVLPAPATGRGLATDLFLGRLENPQFAGGRIDVKMWLYLVGAVMLELNVLSFATFHLQAHGLHASTGILVCAAMLTWFVFDYLTFEEVHLYTYDFVAERVGFKLGWGCLVFYPYFYAVALWSAVDREPGEGGSLVLFMSAVIFFAGWCLARGANMQKFYFKTSPDRTFLGMVPRALDDGERRLLVSGFWGVSRHINYLGEILMGCGIALSVTAYGAWWAWLYPLYYVALLVPRQMDDDARCAARYGDLWRRYVAEVRYRIIPFVY